LHKPTNILNGNETKVNVRIEDDYAYKQGYPGTAMVHSFTNSDADIFFLTSAQLHSVNEKLAFQAKKRQKKNCSEDER